MLNDYFATTSRGLEEVAAQELIRIGAKNVRTDFTGVHFQGDRELLYRANLWTRTTFRILMPIARIKSFDGDELYRNVQKLDWEEYLDPNMTIAVTCTGKSKNLNHTHFTALQIKNAIVDLQKSRRGKRSSVDTENPDLIINAHIDQKHCILSLDSSGSSLHRRGYRPAMGDAPMKETLAAALLEMAEWTPDLPFLDPMCGSGTLPIEATLKALDIAPGLYRDFSFQTWLDYDHDLWQSLLKQASDRQKNSIDIPIIGSDRDLKIIRQAFANAESSGLEDYVKFARQEVSTIEAPADRGVLICNPPYGVRLGNEAELGELYKLLGDIFKQRFRGWTAYILTGSMKLSRQVGLRTSKRIKLYNGAIPCTLLKYEMY
ncbi:THUMP domain-containing class I SAM-dependent RNA methyltransferase [Pleurocapsa sp. FMAR1]|uniref:THUMP domain-containing class I SAM-dependent RNA methyltransferase n=1 Tax=Pleurocapsa sp. FMAR1 TaxID=3040204 RepID=UPI0029C661BB|nr:class I SAM-dependent RNA methyltransferase [Pleurocapsa sp. FMAR1]